MTSNLFYSIGPTGWARMNARLIIWVVGATPLKTQCFQGGAPTTRITRSINGAFIPAHPVYGPIAQLD
jgi:hypothetical protein